MSQMVQRHRIGCLDSNRIIYLKLKKKIKIMQTIFLIMAVDIVMLFCKWN